MRVCVRRTHAGIFSFNWAGSEFGFDVRIKFGMGQEGNEILTQIRSKVRGRSAGKCYSTRVHISNALDRAIYGVYCFTLFVVSTAG